MEELVSLQCLYCTCILPTAPHITTWPDESFLHTETACRPLRSCRIFSQTTTTTWPAESYSWGWVWTSPPFSYAMESVISFYRNPSLKVQMLFPQPWDLIWKDYFILSLKIWKTEAIFLFAPQEGTSKFASLESCAKEHQKRTHKRLQLQREMVRQRLRALTSSAR